MSNNLVVFNFESNDVRTMTDEKGTPWFNANDICAVLGMTNSRKALADHVDPEDVTRRNTPTAGGVQAINHINESGLYALIVGSNKPEAKKFKRWVTSDVLPSIRKTGSYSAPNAQQPVPVSQAQLVSDWVAASMNVAKLWGFTGNQAIIFSDRSTREMTGISMLGLFGATKLVADERGRTYTPTDLGKMIDPPQSPAKMNLLLEACGLQSRDVNKNWNPTSLAESLFEWVDTTKKHKDGTPVKQLRWFDTVLAKVKSNSAMKSVVVS